MSLCPPSQLISSDADGAIQRAGRFRVENGSLDEVTCTVLLWFFCFCFLFLQHCVFVKLYPFLFRGPGKQTSDYTPGTWRRTDVHLENPEYHTRWFFKYFLGKGQCVRAPRRGLNAASRQLPGQTSAGENESLLCVRGLPSLVQRAHLIWQVVQQKGPPSASPLRASSRQQSLQDVHGGRSTP